MGERGYGECERDRESEREREREEKEVNIHVNVYKFDKLYINKFCHSLECTCNE